MSAYQKDLGRAWQEIRRGTGKGCIWKGSEIISITHTHSHTHTHTCSHKAPKAPISYWLWRQDLRKLSFCVSF